MADEKDPDDPPVTPTCNPSETFGILWRELGDVMGSAAAATLVRRAAKSAAPRAPELEQLTILREKFDYRYVVPTAWSTTRGDMTALRELSTDLRVVLVELTGPIVVKRLAGNDDLARWGLFGQEPTEDAP